MLESVAHRLNRLEALADGDKGVSPMPRAKLVVDVAFKIRIAEKHDFCVWARRGVDRRKYTFDPALERPVLDQTLCLREIRSAVGSVPCLGNETVLHDASEVESLPPMVRKITS